MAVIGTSEPAAVLIGFAEAQAGPETSYLLTNAGFAVHAFSRRGVRPPLRRSRQVVVHEVTAPETDAAAAVAEVRTLIAAAGISAVMPLDDAALWVLDRLPDDTRVLLAGPPGPAAGAALDKRVQVRLASEAGLLVPPTAIPLDGSDVSEVDGYPVVVKGALAARLDGSRLVRDGMTTCRNETELRGAIAAAPFAPVLVQPLLSGVGEGLFGHMTEGRVLGWSAHRRVRMMNPQGSGSSACESIPVENALVEPATRFLRELGWRGQFMLEFLREDDGTVWFMELNGRAWGSLALARYRGFAYPAWAVQQALGQPLDPTPPEDAPYVRCRHLGREIAHLAFVARGPRGPVGTPWPSFSRALRDVLRWRRGDRWYNFRRDAIGVFLSDAVWILREQGRRAVRSR